ncbi:hypothetical protein EDB84DRAFT_1482390 [Lactarius hengduanensis]|nr:hypothetical protein EDB84DRAFT_1482390 [Lactarius hengduanensis]
MARATSVADSLPESISRETCPISFVDCDDRDDVRGLPCEDKRVLHRAYVNLWLVRSADTALETMLAGGEPTEWSASQPPCTTSSSHIVAPLRLWQ